jgi:hypothetical protein
MARSGTSSKKSSNTESTPVVPTPVVETPVVPVVVEKKSKKTKTVSSSPVVENTSIDVSMPPPPPVVNVSVEENLVVPEIDEKVFSSFDIDNETSIVVKLNVFGAKIQQLNCLLSSLKNDYKLLEKTVSKELKNAKKSSRRKKLSENRQPSGFVKPTKISDELAIFLGKELGIEMARTDVSKEINGYIRLNSLQDKDNGRKIIPDAKLGALLKIKDGDELTYFNLQRFMKHHFIKAVVPVATVAV